MNLVVLSGRLTKDPELRYGQSGTAFNNFTIAVNRYGNDKGADFINCVAFGKMAEFIAEYFKKGRKILVQGKLQQETWEKDGQKKSTYRVRVVSGEFADSKPKDEKENNDSDYRNTSDKDFLDEEFPF